MDIQEWEDIRWIEIFIKIWREMSEKMKIIMGMVMSALLIERRKLKRYWYDYKEYKEFSEETSISSDEFPF